ncbi:ThiF family adenylyltransferase [Streptomyces incarnatus]|uniref:ThiF family adenylyltransferase n=1 Tax=Streptomyces incarnatus TaxID=665007 RepID=UPI001FC985EE|nr:ThiF family adenylyltransferase [Streptomyces incarnatus]
MLARELFIARDGEDYVPGEVGYRALSPTFVRNAIVRAREERLAYLAVHCHPGGDSVRFSRIDLASHERGYPALRQISGHIVGGVVFTPHAAAGDLWLPDGGRAALSETVIPSGNLVRLRQSPSGSAVCDPLWDRQARLLGDRGQEALSRMRVAVVGLGGVGSLLVEELARLGVGGLVLVDDETVDATNLPRLVAAERGDVGELKTNVAARNAIRANPSVRLAPIPRRVEHHESLRELSRTDWIFLAADSHAARHWVNAVVQEYLIPATQVGVKIPVVGGGEIGQIHTATRLIAPGVGCFWCNRLIDRTELAIEMHPADERERARYVPGVPAPSVMPLNTLAAGEALTHFLLATALLHGDDGDLGSVIHRPRSRERGLQDSRQDADCRWCTAAGNLARGDRGEVAMRVASAELQRT